MSNKYDSYKDSGVEWIGDIPNHWKSTKVKFEILSKGYKAGPFGSSLITSELLLNGTIKVFSPEHVAEKEILEEWYLPDDRAQEMSQFIVNDKDVVLPIVGTLGLARVFHSNIDGNGIINQRLAKISSNSNRLVPEFFCLIMKDVSNYQEYFKLKARGSILSHLNKETIVSMPIVLPDIEEQELIINYLDNKTTQIDNLIAKKEQFIQLLEEERVAVINQAVTKGLDPNVAMKDSGIDWLGKIPKHWEVKIIKHTTYVKGRIGWKGLRSDEFLEFSDSYVVTGTDFHNGTIKWESCYQVPIDRYEDDPFIKLQNDDLLITKDGTIGKIAIVKDMPKIATLNSGVFLTRPLENEYYQEFMYWILYSDVFKSFYDFNKSGSTIQHLYQNVFNEFKYPLPPIKEQIEIVNHINYKTDELDLVISKTKQEIELLKEYKTALISEVVTGKVDVRHEKLN